VEAERANRMKILVAIANYGTGNDPFLAQLLAEYHAMPYDMHIAVLSNIPKSLGPDVEVIVGLPDEKNPWSLPFAHRKLFAERRNDYDLYIYTEDDTLLRRKNLEAFFQAMPALPSGALAGFVRCEIDAHGGVYYSTVHNHFHWDPGSVFRAGDQVFAHFKNEHAACFLLTRELPPTAINSGRFLVPPHRGRYGMLEAAATDPYTQCGFRKMICISQLDDFTLPHLPNKYVGKLGLPKRDFELQVQALLDVANGKPLAPPPLGKETQLPLGRWSKSYYEPASSDLLAFVPQEASRILSVGCGWGALEAALISRGARVAGIPLDSVIAPCAASRGVEMVAGSDPLNLSTLPDGAFDAVVLSNILHLVPDPPEYLRQLARSLTAGGRLILRVPHVGGWPLWKMKQRSNGEFRAPDSFGQSGVHQTSAPVLRRWMREAGLQIARFRAIAEDRAATASKLTLGLATSLLAEEFLAVGRNTSL